MKVQMHELNHTDACAAKRKFGVITKQSSTDYMKKAGIIKAAISAILIDRTLKVSELEDYLQNEFVKVNYTSDKQRAIHAHEAYRQILRYVSQERRPLIKGIQADIDLGQGLTVEVAPDLIYVSQDTVEVIKLKPSKPNVTYSNIAQDLGMYALFCYAKALVPKGQKKRLKASYYYLRASQDDTVYFVPTFDEPGSNQILTLQQEYENDGKPTNTDQMYEPAVRKYVEALPKEECTKEDCAKCSLFDLCKFTVAPLMLVKTKVNKSLSDLQLTEAQEKVIDYKKGICRVNAGAGAGKTMVIAIRTATLLSKGVKPEEMLLITFTNAGAEEMRSRIGLILEDFGLEIDTGKLTIVTFNAFGDLILKEEFTRFGFTQPPKVIDDIERSRIITDLLNQYPVDGLDYKNFDANMKNLKGALAVTKKIFDIVKTGQYCAADAKTVRDEMGMDKRFASTQTVEAVIRLYDKYDDKLREDNLIEFADQEGFLFELLRDEPFYLEKFGFKHIIVDEFQDTNENQIKLVKKLTEGPDFESLMVVGDDSQAIFSFRNTSPEYILHFEKYMGCPVDDIFLMENHRSVPEILEFANKINETRSTYVSKKLIATRPSNGKPVIVKGFLTPEDEQTYIVDGIVQRIKAGERSENIAIIAATKYELMKMADLLEKRNIQTVMLNPEPMIENSRIRAAIAFIRALQDPTDTQDMLVFANAYNPDHDLMTESDKDVEAQIHAVGKMVEEMRAMKSAEKKSKLMEVLKEIDENEDEVYESFLDGLSMKHLRQIFQYCNDFYRFGSTAAVRRTHDYPGVVLTTAHSSKGLEWPIVFNMISKYDSPELHKKSGISASMTEEKKRLLFVSATRARDELIVTAQYDAFGKRGEYTYNQFLLMAGKAAGTPITWEQIEKERAERDRRRKEEKEKAKREALAKLIS